MQLHTLFMKTKNTFIIKITKFSYFFIAIFHLAIEENLVAKIILQKKKEETEKNR